jgi:ERCC4-type nuclease
MQQEDIQLIVDVRERDLLACLDQTKGWNMGITIVKESLPIGDILLRQGNETLLIVERKTIADLSASIRDGRYREQSLRLQQTSGLPAHHIVYLVEGEMLPRKPLLRLPSEEKPVNAYLYSACVSLFYYKGFSVMRTNHLEESAFFLINMAKKIQTEQREKNALPFYQILSNPVITDPLQNETQDYTSVAIHKIKKDNITRDNIWVIMLSQIPSISPAVCQSLMNKFGSGLALLNALHNSPTPNEAMQLFDGIMVNGRKLNRTCAEKLVAFFSVS